MEAAQSLLRMFEPSFRYLELRFVGRVLVDEAGARDVVARSPVHLARAREAGSSLALELTRPRPADRGAHP